MLNESVTIRYGYFSTAKSIKMSMCQWKHKLKNKRKHILFFHCHFLSSEKFQQIVRTIRVKHYPIFLHLEPNLETLFRKLDMPRVPGFQKRFPKNCLFGKNEKKCGAPFLETQACVDCYLGKKRNTFR